MRQLAQPNIQVLGFQPDNVVEKYMASAKAFVYAAYEDFGIAPVEAQACGTPVIAFGAGGTSETVRDIRQHPNSGTGILFAEQSVTAIIDAVKTFVGYEGKFNLEVARSHAAKFSPDIFQQHYLEYVDRCYRRKQKVSPKNSLFPPSPSPTLD
jgi:glycosyltransferase involved in cell wall biosynthesis